ncbi:MAG: hypothetical protein RI883_2118 [Bacteroidota bacterium]|jgi:hypothetical protein
MRNTLIAIIITFLTIQSNAQIWDFDGVMRLPGTVNSDAEETLPVFSKDSSELFFIRSFDKQNKGGEYDQDIWTSYRQSDGSYTDCKQLSSLNSKYNNGVIGINTTGDVLYLLHSYEGKKDLEKGIAVSTSKGSGWSTPEKIEVPGLDIEGDYYGYHISNDENVMFISYKGIETFGEEDIYISLKSENGWSSPLNLGSSINTSGFEMSPFLSPNQDTLFFASNGHGGLGDADIFYSVKKGSWTDWGKPVNLGPKINSSKFDACFSYSKNQVYWSSNKETERSDIYTAYFIYPPPVTISCIATNSTLKDGANGSVDATVEGGLPPFSFVWSNGSNEEDISGLSKGDYSIEVTDSYGQKASASCFVDEVIYIPEVIATAYKNIEFIHYFEYNKNKLDIDKGKLKRFMKDVEDQLKEGRPNITINIYSSASHVPTKTYETNEKLTQIRAENMKYDIIAYFAKKEEYKNRVNVAIVTAIVDGPDYNEDANNDKKYIPYQFVGLKTE